MFAFSQRHLRSLGVSHQHHTLHGLRGGGVTDQWLSVSRLTTFDDAEVGGPQKEPLNVTFRMALPQFTKTRLSEKIANRLSALANLAPRFFAEQDY